MSAEYGVRSGEEAIASALRLRLALALNVWLSTLDPRLSTGGGLSGGS